MEYQSILSGRNPFFFTCSYRSSQMHVHCDMEVLYCVRGQATVIIENKEYFLLKDTVLLINPFDVHKVINDNQASILVLRFGSHFLGAEYREFIMHKFTNCPFSPDVACTYKNHLLFPLNRLYEEHITQKNGSIWAIKGLLYDVFAMIVRYVPIEQQDAARTKSIEHFLKIQKVFDLVQDEYREDITLEYVAGLLGYNKRYFCRIFKNVTNMTFHEYLNSHRIEVSMRLLEHNEHSVGEIGQMVGIPVAKSFCRLFHKYVGMSPREYRNISLGKK